jgi:hypothetical protein
LSWAAESGLPRVALPLLLAFLGLTMLAAFPFMLHEIRHRAQRLLALRSPRAPDRVHLVTADLTPFELSHEQRARILTG